MSDNPEALPELPRPFVPGDEFNPRDFYTAEQMRAYARAAIAQQAATPTLTDEQIERAWLETTDHYALGKLAAFAFAEKLRAAVAASRQAATPAPAEPQGLSVAQEPKYTVSGSAIVNRASGEAIPADEPVFIFRARDVHAVRALVAYSIALSPGPHRYAVEQRITDFARFKTGHPDRMKEPDTAAPPATPAAQPADEREAFEAWAVRTHGKYTLSDPDAGSMWSAWQARAALEGQG